MNRHPGGNEHTLKMLSLAGISSGAVLDMGAGDGESIALLKSLGIDAIGIDLRPGNEAVLCGDMLKSGFSPMSFDGVLAQCSFFVSGDVPGALREAHRVLKPGGKLMLSDVCFEDIRSLITSAGFVLEYEEDMTALWREYWLEALWNGTADCCNVRGKCRYMLYICRKE